MEYRKLISFGKSSHVISLPKSWIVQNKLQKGDMIYLDEAESSLILSPHRQKDLVEKEISINVEGKSVRRLQREIISAYIKDYKTITLFGNDLKDKAKKIQATIQNLMALEVMEQTSKKIVAKDFLDMNNISIDNLIRKIDVILRAMMEDCLTMFTEDNYENIEHRDNDVNRLTFLVFRVVEFGLENSSFMYKKFSLKSRDLLGLWWFVFNLEAIGDDIKRIARYMLEVKLDKKQKERFINLLSESKVSYLKILKSFYIKDVENVHLVLETKDKILNECQSFYLDNKKVENVGLLSEKIKSMVNIIHNLGRVIYQHEFIKE